MSMLRSAGLAMIGSLLLSGPVLAFQPGNDQCANAITLTCDQGTNNTLTDAKDDDPELLKEGEGKTKELLRDVYYVLDLPSGKWDVTVKVIGLANAAIEKPVLYMASTDIANPCGGPFAHYKKQTFATEADEELNQNDSFELSQECLLGGKYLLELACAKNPGDGKGDYRIEVTCQKCDPPAPANGNAAKKDGANENNFEPNDEVYFNGSLTPEVFCDIYVVPSQFLPDQAVIPARESGSALFVATDANGAPTFTNLEFEGQSESDPGIADTVAPALVWPSARRGNYMIVVDRDNNGLFDAAYDVITPSFQVSGSPAVPVLSGLYWIAALVLSFVGAAVFLFRRH